MAAASSPAAEGFAISLDSPAPSIAMAAAGRSGGGSSGGGHSTTSSSGASGGRNAAAASGPPVIGNANSRSVSTASVSSEGSNGSHVVDRVEMAALTNDVREFKEALARLRKVFNPDVEPTETVRVACHERLGDVLKILRGIMKKYPPLQASDLVLSAQHLINQVKEFSVPDEDSVDEKEFHAALDALARKFSNRVSEYLMQDIDSAASSTSSKEKELEGMALELRGETLIPEHMDSVEARPLGTRNFDIDSLLMRHHQGVDHALKYAKIWAKYAKDIINYVEKRTNLELEWARGLTKLAQATRPILKEESYLPFQSVYCTALDQDLEMCASTQATCSLLQGYKFIEPLFARRAEHQKARKGLKDRWTKELKLLQETVSNLKKAKSLYMERNKEYERCREAVRIAEQGAEIGATGENKVDKRKRLEEDALEKRAESENLYHNCVDEANEKHRQLLMVKADVLQQIRELINQCDQTVKAVTVSYFQLQHTLTAPVPTQFQTLCERSRLYDPGSQFMEFVRCGLGDQPPPSRFSTSDPFIFEPYSDDTYVDRPAVQRRSSASLEAGGDEYGSGTYRFRGDSLGATTAVVAGAGAGGGGGGAAAGNSGPMMAWTPATIGPMEPSDTDSVESRDSCKSRDTSPSASPMIPVRHLIPHGSMPLAEDVDNVDHGGHAGEAVSTNTSHVDGASGMLGGSVPRRSVNISIAARTHKFRKLKTPSKCRECDSYVYLQGYGCQDCGLSAHKKCLEVLALQCGHKRLPSKMKTFGVDLGQHLLESGAQVPPLVCKCVHEIDKRGIKLEGIYRRSGAKIKIDKLCQMFETAPELVELTDVQPFAIADVLKLYMRQLPEPLITFQLYPEFISVAKSFSTSNASEPGTAAVIRELSELCRKLPKPHLRTLGFLMHHLSRVAKESKENHMHASNLAILFGPTLMRTTDETASLSALSHVDQTRTIELLILHATPIFGSPESVLPKDYARYTTSAAAVLGAVGTGVKRVGRPKSRKYGSGSGADLISSQTERRSVEVQDDFHTLPGHVVTEPSNEDYPSDEDDEDEAIPSCWLPDDSARTKKSPLLNRGASPPPKIIKQPLKGFTGLEGVTAERLSTQDSLENAQRLSKQASSEVISNASSNVSSRKSIPHESSGGLSIRQHRTSETLFSRVGRAAKKHSLDEDFLSPPAHPPLSERLSSEPGFVLGTPAASQDATRKTPSPSSGGGGDTVDGGGGADVLKSSTSPSSGRTSLTIGIGSSSSSSTSSSAAALTHPGRSSSLSDDHATLSVAEQRRKFLASASTEFGAQPGGGGGGSAASAAAVMPSAHHPHSRSIGIIHSSMSSSLPTSIPNLDENRVKIQVPGGIQSSNSVAASKPATAVKQSSVDKGDS